MSRLFETLRVDIGRTWDLQKGGRLRRTIECMRAPGVHAVIVYRFGRWIKTFPMPIRLLFEPFYQVLYVLIQVVWGIELPRSANIGAGLYIGHFGCISISPGLVMGGYCNLSPGITLGGVSGQGEKRGVPVIGSNVYVAPGARIIGKITIGDNVKIGANAVVYKDIPDNAIVVLDPGYKIISYAGNQPPQK